MYWTCNVSARTDQLRAVGMFDEAFQRWGGEDLDLGYRLHRDGARFGVNRPGRPLPSSARTAPEKSTLIKLLCGFYRPSRGRILVDGTDRADAGGLVDELPDGLRTLLGTSYADGETGGDQDRWDRRLRVPPVCHGARGRSDRRRPGRPGGGTGDHATLSAGTGSYTELFALQAKAYS